MFMLYEKMRIIFVRVRFCINFFIIFVNLDFFFKRGGGDSFVCNGRVGDLRLVFCNFII